MTRPLVAVLAMLSVGLPAMAHAQSARAQLEDGHAKVVGTATLSEVPGGVRVSLRMNGLKPGEHGFHIHAVGRCEPHDFMSAGPHFNPYGKHHGLANPDGPHAGDFANLEVGADGTGSLDTIDSLVTLKEGSNSLFQPGGTRAPKTGVLRATHFAIVRDCVQVINPDGVPNQIEGNAVQTVSRTLKEQVTFDRSRVTSLDWASYPILTFPEIPTVDIELVDRPTDKPWGAGEPAAAVVPAAIANAVFDAIGVRLRSVPFRPAKVLAALQAGR